MPRPKRDAAIRDVAAQVQLGALLDRYPRQLSGGQRQRVALARAMVRRPKLFLMDEPLSNLDAKLRGHMRAELKHMQHSLGITTIYVTHDQVEAMTLAHRVALLEDGKLMQLDTPRNHLQRPGQSVRRWLHRLAADEHDARRAGGRLLRQASVKIGDGVGSTPSVVLGVRPEDGAIVAPGQGAIAGEVFATELIGDHTLVTATAGTDSIAVKAPKDFQANVGEPVAIDFAASRLYLFDADERRSAALV